MSTFATKTSLMALEIRTIPVLERRNAERILQIMENEKEPSSKISIDREAWKDFAGLEERSKKFNYSEWRKASI